MKPEAAGSAAAERPKNAGNFIVRPARDALATALLIFLTSAICILIIDHFARESQRELVRGDLLRSANAAAGLVDGDKHRMMASSGSLSLNDPLYQELIDPLVAMHRRVPEVAYLYSFVERDGKLYFVLDTATQAQRLGFQREMKPSGLMELYQSESPTEDAREAVAVRKGEPYVATEPVEDDYGTFITGLAPILDSAGHPAGAIGVDLDVTHLYQRLARNRFAMLSGLGAAALAAVTIGFLVWSIRRRALRAERDLIAAKDLAEEANRAKSEFLAVMSHEIRTPLNGVLGFANLLQHTRLDDAQQEYLRTIASCGDALLTIIDDILDFSRMEAGRLELESQPFDLRECVERMLDVHATRAFTKKLELVSEFDNDVPTDVVGDAGRLGQVFSNLIGNAVKFTQTGEIVVACRLAWIDSESVIVEFVVSDTGIGIDREKQERIFEPFVQADSSMSRRYGGSGLGLAICLRLVRAMEGSISVTSEPGTGTKFHFRVQLKRGSSAGLPAPKDLKGLHVLVGEPNGALRSSLVRLLSGYGVEAVGCRDFDAMRAAADLEKRIDLILVDSSFLAAADSLADLARNVPIVLLVPLGVPASQLPPSLSNEWRRLPKPVHASALRAVLESTLNGGESAAPSAAASPHIRDGAAAPDPSHTRILLVEDNLINQKLVWRMLANLGYEAEIASGGQECLDVCARGRFDVIFMDIQMPGMDGFEVAEQLRKHGDPVWIVALTAHVMSEDRERCVAAGMNDFVAKPIHIDALQDALTRYARELKS